jgi:hypothetical protein
MGGGWVNKPKSPSTEARRAVKRCPRALIGLRANYRVFGGQRVDLFTLWITHPLYRVIRGEIYRVIRGVGLVSSGANYRVIGGRCRN